MPRRLALPLIAALLPAAPLSAQTCEDRIEDFEARIALCEAAATDAQEPETAAIALGYKGEAERMLGRLEAAAVTLRKAIALAPANAWSWTELGTVALDAEDPAGAVAMYTTALDLAPGDTYTLGNRADAWRMLGAAQRCSADAAAVLAALPDDLFAHLTQGRCLIDLGRPDAALGHLDKVIGADPGWLDAYPARMKALMVLGRHDEALAFADQVLASEAAGTAPPEFTADIRMRRLAAQARLLPVDRVLEEAAALVRDYPDDPRITNVSVWALVRAGRLDAAEEAAPALRALAGTPAMEGVFHDTLAQLDLAEGRIDAAAEGFSRALWLDPALSRGFARRLSESGFLPLSSQPHDVLVALRRCLEAKGGACQMGG